MSLRIRRGTNAQRTGITFDLGEIVYTTDTQKLYIGDGVTAGGKNLLETSAGNGFTFNPTTQQIDFAIGNLNLNTAQVSESSNLYFTTERAQDAVGAALVAGNAFNTGVTFTYDDANNRITAVATGSAGLTTVSSDTNPSLGGNLSTGAFNISGNGSITAGTITATNLGGNLSTGAFNISGTGSITAGTITATTGLGENLPLNSKNITGSGSIGITGNISNTGNIVTTGNITGTGNITRSGSIDVTGTIKAQTGLGADLPLNLFGITGTGNINITGAVVAGAISGATVTTTEISGKTLGLGPDATDGKSGISILTTANENDDYDLFSIAAFHNGGAANYGNSSQYLRARGTPASPSAVQTGDFIHKLAFIAVTSSSTSVKNAEITVEVDTGTINATQAPAKMSFNTMTNAGSLATALTIDSASVIGFASTQQLVAGAGSGQVNVGGGVVAYVRLKVGTTTYAMPLYNINA